MRLRTPENQNGEALGVGRMNFNAGVRLEFSATESVSTPALQAGVYVVAVSSDVFLTVGPAAGDAPGSIPGFSGSWMTMVIRSGDQISARGVSASGVLYAVPLETV